GVEASDRAPGAVLRRQRVRSGEREGVHLGARAQVEVEVVELAWNDRDQRSPAGEEEVVSAAEEAVRLLGDRRPFAGWAGTRARRRRSEGHDEHLTAC